MALGKGMSLKDLISGFHDGIKGVVLGSVILLLAITIGNVSTETGGGVFLVEQLGDALPYFLLPVMLQLMTMVIAFSTGTSWGTYAVAFPLAMPLAWAVAGAQGLSHPELFMTLCFASVMDGSVYGDQCSPISDTTVLSSVCTGCDLMDHVKTQDPAGVGWPPDWPRSAGPCSRSSRRELRAGPLTAAADGPPSACAKRAPPEPRRCSLVACASASLRRSRRTSTASPSPRPASPRSWRAGTRWSSRREPGSAARSPTRPTRPPAPAWSTVRTRYGNARISSSR